MSVSQHKWRRRAYGFIFTQRFSTVWWQIGTEALCCHSPSLCEDSLWSPSSPSSSSSPGRLAPQHPVQRNPAEDDEKAAAAPVHRSDGEALHGGWELLLLSTAHFVLCLPLWTYLLHPVLFFSCTANAQITRKSKFPTIYHTQSLWYCYLIKNLIQNCCILISVNLKSCKHCHKWLNCILLAFVSLFKRHDVSCGSKQFN